MPASTFNPADKGPNVTLSGGNLTLTAAAVLSLGASRSIYSTSTGKFYNEFTATNSYSLGWANVAADLATNDRTYVILVDASGNISSGGGVTVANIGTPASSNQLFGAAIDIDAYRVWFRLGAAGLWNGSGTANPATGVGGITPALLAFPLFAYALATNTGTTARVTANFGASAMSGVVPAGFAVGWGSALPIGGAAQQHALIMA